MIYLDTHAVLWLYAGELNSFPKNVLFLIEENELRCSPIVKLELTYLKEIKRITERPAVIIKHLKDAIGLTSCTQDFDSVVTKALAMSWTRDPFDRIITAQASMNKSILVTKDDIILKNYKHAVWH